MGFLPMTLDWHYKQGKRKIEEPEKSTHLFALAAGIPFDTSRYSPVQPFCAGASGDITKRTRPSGLYDARGAGRSIIPGFV